MVEKGQGRKHHGNGIISQRNQTVHLFCTWEPFQKIFFIPFLPKSLGDEGTGVPKIRITSFIRSGESRKRAPSLGFRAVLDPATVIQVVTYVVDRTALSLGTNQLRRFGRRFKPLPPHPIKAPRNLHKAPFRLGCQRSDAKGNTIHLWPGQWFAFLPTLSP